MRYFQNSSVFIVYIVLLACSTQNSILIDDRNIFTIRNSNLNFEIVTKHNGFVRVDDLADLVFKKKITPKIEVTFSFDGRKKIMLEEVVIQADTFSLESLDSLMLKYHFAPITPVCLTGGEIVHRFPDGGTMEETLAYGFAARQGITGYHWICYFREAMNGTAELTCENYFPDYFPVNDNE